VIDTHCHLDVCDPPEQDLLDRARLAGLTRLATVGMDADGIERALAAAHAYDEVSAIVGRHPNKAAGFGDADLEVIERASADPEARAIGETGLDYYRDGAPRDDQRRAFEAQIDLAARAGLPLVVHTREAEEDTFSILRERAGGVTVVLHCFSAPSKLDECVERGYFCSFAGNVTYPRNGELQEAARAVPEELLLVETDAPFLSPVPLRGKPNEPAYVVRTAKRVAELRGVDYEQLDALVERNAARVFGW
jgi:TatD DNase family protein